MKKIMNNFINSFMNFFKFKRGFVTLGFLIILFYYTYLIIKKRLNVKEGMERSPADGVRLCQDNRCMPGCIKPRFLSNNCESSIYKNPDGKCYMKCPYECQSPLDKCKYDDCCKGCGKTKVEVPCIGFRKMQNLNPGLAQDQNDTMDMPDIVYNDTPIGNADDSTAMNSNIKAKVLDENMNDLSKIYNEKTGYNLRYPGNMLCSANITNTFTECGLPAANSCL
jgi:hypothetical protein